MKNTFFLHAERVGVMGNGFCQYELLLHWITPGNRENSNTHKNKKKIPYRRKKKSRKYTQARTTKLHLAIAIAINAFPLLRIYIHKHIQEAKYFIMQYEHSLTGQSLFFIPFLFSLFRYVYMQDMGFFLVHILLCVCVCVFKRGKSVKANEKKNFIWKYPIPQWFCLFDAIHTISAYCNKYIECEPIHFFLSAGWMAHQQTIQSNASTLHTKYYMQSFLLCYMHYWMAVRLYAYKFHSYS